MNTTAATHVVVGAGATGSATALKLAQEGHSVKVITRSGSGPTHTSIELIAADASNGAVLTRLTTGASAIYNCANPPYNKWKTEWPPLSAALLQAAETNDAVLVTLSNLYGYRSTNPMRASDPLDPPSVKGGIRVKMWNDALAAHHAGRVRITEARASDFIGPGVGENGHMGDRVVPRVLAGKSVSLLGKTDVAHSWTAINDVATTLATIGSDERAWGEAWHVPTGAPLSQAQLVHRMCELAGVEPVKVKTIPKAAIAAIGLFVPVMRELKEVGYQFEQPFVIEATATTEMFGLEATPLDETLKATLQSYQAKAS